MGHQTIAFSPNGRWAVAEGAQSNLGLWDTTPGSPVRRIPSPGGGLASLAVSPDGLLVAVGRRDGFIALLAADTGREALRVEAHHDTVSALAFSPDGAVLASGGADGTVRLWTVRNGAPLQRCLGHDRSVRVLAFSRDGTRLASGGGDAVIMVWNVAPGRPAPALPPLDAVARQEHWAALASEDAKHAIRAIWALAEAGDPVVPFLVGHLTSDDEAAALQARIDRLIRSLDDDRYDLRERASRELQEIGLAAEAALKEAVEAGTSLEFRVRADLLLAHYAKSDETPSPTNIRRSRAIRILECIASPASRAALEKLAATAYSPRERAEAKAALQRLKPPQ
jgi:hypothetical protein